MMSFGQSAVHRFALIVLSTLLIVGCSDDPTKPPDEGYPAATTIEQLLANFKLAHEEKNYAEYEQLLGEDFAFVFDPRDVGPSKPWNDEIWRRDEDLRSAQRMFDGETNGFGRVLDDITLSFEAGEPQISPENEEWQLVVLTAIDLKLSTTEQASGDQWILQTSGGYEAYLHLVLVEGEGDTQVWKIVRWEDKPPLGLPAGAATEDGSWGAFKVLWLQPTGYPEATTIDQLLDNFERAYRNGNYEEYEKLLADDYTFAFDPRDVHPETPWSDGTWGRVDDLIGAQNMFGGHPNNNRLTMDEIRLRFDAGQPQVSPENSEWQMVVLSAVDLTVAATEESSGEAWLLQTPGNYMAHLHLIETEPLEGPPIWKIIHWEDKAPVLPAGSAIARLTWGQIKMSWHELTSYPGATTIEQLFENFGRAWEEMKYEEYVKLLDEGFTFVFDPRDIGLDKPWQDSTWGRSEELQSASNMFGGEPNLDGRIVDDIRLLFDVGEPEISSENDEWQQAHLTAVDLKIYTTEQQSGDQWILQTPGGYEAYLHVLQTDEIDPWTGESILKIIMWEDKPPHKRLAGAAVQGTTWGGIKILFL